MFTLSFGSIMLQLQQEKEGYDHVSWFWLLTSNDWNLSATENPSSVVIFQMHSLFGL